jgi:hypothetical protein
MVKRVFAGLLLVAVLGSGQRRVDPKNTYSRVICVVPLVGTGTTDDPKRPQYAPWPASQDPNGITAFFFQPSDDGKYAVAEFVSRNRLALQPILNDKTIKVFEEGRQSKASIESAIKPFRKDFDLTKFGMVMP